MKLKDSRENYYFYSGKLSDIMRNLAILGFGLAYLFGELKNIATQKVIKFFIVFLFVALLLDFFQYVYGTIAWDVFNRKKEKEHKLNENSKFIVHGGINILTAILFYLKIVFIIMAYLCFILYFYKNYF